MNAASFLSVDVDSVASHLQGYGFRDAELDGKAYERAIPRILEVLAQNNARCTFFLIAREAARQRAVVQSIVGAGCEVACHSMTHPLPFVLSDPAVRQREIGDARMMLEDIAGVPIVGFRAPSWDVHQDMTPWLIEAGYLYDASSYPSWVLLLLRWSVSRRSGSSRSSARFIDRRTMFGDPHPHVRVHNGLPLVEIPITTVPFLRIPFYHTIRFILPHTLFSGLSMLAGLRRGPVGYVFHAVDYLDLATDSLDPRIARHPGMKIPLQTKTHLAATAIQKLTRRGPVVTLESLAREILRESPRGN